VLQRRLELLRLRELELVEWANVREAVGWKIGRFELLHAVESVASRKTVAVEVSKTRVYLSL
jgi:hypothetical protein